MVSFALWLQEGAFISHLEGQTKTRGRWEGSRCSESECIRLKKLHIIQQREVSHCVMLDEYKEKEVMAIRYAKLRK